MNLSLPTVVIFMVGTILIYSAVKGIDPRDVVRLTLAGKDPSKINDVGKGVGKAGGKAASEAAKLFAQPSVNHPAGYVSV